MSKEWECVYTRAECHHKGTKCSECPITDLICDEFTECLDLSYEQGKTDGTREFAEWLCKKLDNNGFVYASELLEEYEKEGNK